MPDDDKATEHNEEEEKEVEIEEDEEAFAEEIEDEKKADEKEKEEATKDKKEKDEELDEKGEKVEKKAEKKEPEKKEDKKEKEEKDLSAKEKLDKHLESIKDEEGEEKEEEPEKKVEKEEKVEKKEEKKEKEDKPLKLTKELISERLKLISSDDLPGEVIVGDETINLQQYAKDYPDDYSAIRVLSSLVAEKMIEKALDGVSSVKPEDFDEKIGGLELKVNQLSFDNTVVQATDKEGNLKHPDYFSIVYGAGMKGFHVWIKEQSPKMQKLASSLDPEDGVMIMDYYKEDTAKKKTGEHDKKTKDKKKEYDDLYKSEKSVKKNQSEHSQGDKSADEEAEDSFNE